MGDITRWHDRNHIHVGVPGKDRVEEILSQMKIRAMTTTEPINHIITSHLRLMPPNTSEYIPTTNAIRQSLLRARRTAQVNNLSLHSTTQSGEQFLRYNEDGMMIFAADSDLEFLANSDHIFGDGTFKITPEGFVQQYTIHAYHDGVTYPCVYALLPGMGESVYDKFLDQLLLLLPPTLGKPVSIMTDFELAAINSFKTHFPWAEVSGCYFHLGQAIWRKLQHLELSERYKNDPAFALRIRKFLALSFVPPRLVHEYFGLLLAEEQVTGDGLLTDFVGYFQATYIGYQAPNGVETDARYPYHTWNMYQRVKDRLPRTNNSLEGWHHAFAQGIPAHPRLHVLVDKYHAQQHTMAIRRDQQNMGRAVHARTRNKYATYNTRLIGLIDKFDRGVLQNLQFLQNLARIATFNTD